MFSLIKTQDELADIDKESAIDTENELNVQKSVLKNEIKIIPVITHDVGGKFYIKKKISDLLNE